MYGVELDDVKIGGKSTGVCKGLAKGVECLVTFDSGTGHAAAPIFAYDKFKAMDEALFGVKGKPCKSKRDFGDLTFVIGGKDYALPGEEWVSVLGPGELA